MRAMWEIVAAGVLRSQAETVRAWRRCACVHCGARFRYRITRRIAPRGQSSPEELNRELQGLLKNEVEDHPCPRCGRLQPDMVGRKRGGLHGVLLLLAFGTLIALTASGLVHVHDVPGRLAPLLAGIGAIHLMVRFVGNRGGASGIEAAKAEVATGTLTLEDGAGPPGPSHITGNPWKRALILFVAAPAMTLVVVGAFELKHWKRNDAVDPPVLGPGDTAAFVTAPTSPFAETVRVSCSLLDGEPDAYLTRHVLRSQSGDFSDYRLSIRPAPELSGAAIEVAGMTLHLAQPHTGVVYTWLWRISVFGALLVHCLGGIALWRSAHAATGGGEIVDAVIGA
jgi:hypothetical protein